MSAHATTNRKVALGLASLALTLALAVLGGNIRNGTVWIADWVTWQRTLFLLCLVDAALVGWPPVRDFLRGDWQPFLDHRLREKDREDEQG